MDDRPAIACRLSTLLALGWFRMKIKELSCFAVDIPTKDDVYVMSHGRVLTSFPSTVVRVTADDGTVGYGEACTLGGNYLDGFPESARETIRSLAGWVLGCDVF